MAEHTYSQIARVLKAEFSTGHLRWLPRTPDMFNGDSGRHVAACNAWNAQFAGKPAMDSDNGSGYLRGAYQKRPYFAHRVIWLLYTGAWPDAQIDHINGIKWDNRIENLRPVEAAENMKNKKVQRGNKSGMQGLNWNEKMQKWCASITVNRKSIYLGSFERFADAAEQRIAAEARFGFHENHGR